MSHGIYGFRDVNIVKILSNIHLYVKRFIITSNNNNVKWFVIHFDRTVLLIQYWSAWSKYVQLNRAKQLLLAKANNHYRTKTYIKSVIY